MSIKCYKGMGPEYDGITIYPEDAFPFACCECGIRVEDANAKDHKEFREMFVEWFFSGPWYESEEEDEEESMVIE